MQPTCPCGSTAFSVDPSFPVMGTDLLYALIHCDTCGAPIAVLEQGNVNSALEQQETAIDELSGQIVGLETKIDSVLKELSAIRERLRNQ
jgi:hypothetical protein